ncbi:MAG: DUF3301 domain-containing protein [Francisella sp.]
MSIALYTLIFILLIVFTWRNFLKHKEYAISLAEHTAFKHNLELLDDTVCLRNINVRFENKKLCFYRVYSFDYNTQTSDDRYRGYIVLKNGKVYDIVVSDFEKADILKEGIISESSSQKKVYNPANNIISFDE